MRALWHRLSLRGRLLFGLLIVQTVAFGAAVGLTQHAARQVADKALSEIADREAHLLALSVTDALIVADFEHVGVLLRRSALTGGISWIRLKSGAETIEVEGAPFAALRPEWFARFLDLPEKRAHREISVGGRHYATIHVALSPRVVEQRIWQLLQAFFSAFLAASVVLALLMAWLTRTNLKGLACLAALGEDHAARASAHLAQLPPNAPPEIRRTAQVLQTAQERTQHLLDALAREKERWHRVVESLGEAVFVVSPGGTVEFMNPAAKRLTQLSEEAALGHPVESVLSLSSVGQSAESLHFVLKALHLGEEKAGSDLRLKTAQGEIIPVSATVTPFFGGSTIVQGALVVLRDERERERRIRHLERLALHDPLTDLLNRRGLEARLARILDQLRDRHPVASGVFAYVDLDRFKIVNDTCGHTTGDELLTEIAHLMQATLAVSVEEARVMPILGRIGGDEFGLLLPGYGLEQARVRANLMLRAIQRHVFRHGPRSFRLGASIGLVDLKPGDESGRIFARADAAAYLAKRKGGNRIEIWRPDDAQLQVQSEEMEWLGRLDRYFKEKRFQLWRQRIVSLASPVQDARYEVLLRYIDERGVIRSPSTLLAAAERYGRADEIDRWVVESILTHLREHPDEKAVFSVNLSALSLGNEQFFDFLAQSIRDVGHLPDRLQFEVTETAIMRDVDTTLRFVRKLRSLGCRLAIDDFGTGMASLAYLKRLPVDELKIDKAFVREVGANAADRAIIEAIARLGRRLDIKIVAEGIDEEAVLEALRGMGVDFGQGYFIHRPEPFYAPTGL